MARRWGDRPGTDRYDAVVIGAGPGGRAVARALAGERRRVAMVERELVGGECPFWACIPTKTLLRPVELRSGARHFPGLASPPAEWSEIASYRDYMNSGLDDTDKTEAHERMGIEVIHADARVAGPRLVAIEGRELETESIVVATGTSSAIPPLDGLEAVDYWTNREATALREVPRSAIVLGGGPVGVELGQLLAGFGSEVTLVEAADRVLSHEEPELSELFGRLLSRQLELRLGTQAHGVERAGREVRLTLDTGEELSAERLVVAVGRKPRVDLGLENVALEPDGGAIDVDERCRASDGVWAVGDVTGVAMFTHVASYQGRIAAGDMLGREVRAEYRAIPRVVFSVPEVAAVGLTATQAADRGLDTVAAHVELADLDRTETYGRGLEGRVGAVADRGRGVLVGAWAVGPLASEWIHVFVLAIKAEVPVEVLSDTVMQFPSFSEGVQAAARALRL